MEYTKEDLTAIHNILNQVTVKLPEAQFFLDLIKKTEQMIATESKQVRE